MDTLPALLVFAIATSVTPGPNVLMVATAAANHGVRPVVPHMLGITIGFGIMHIVVGLGLAAPLAASPGLHLALKWIGAAWLLYLAWKIARAGRPGQGEARLLGFWGAAAFQWVNPKAWLIALASLPAFTQPGQPLLPQALLIAAVFVLVSMPCLLLWAGLGSGMRRFLDRPSRLQAFNITMAALLVASLVPALR